MTRRLVIFDVDGTLVDSQADILGSMNAAFRIAGLPEPSREKVLGIVGLSLPEAMALLAPEVPRDMHHRMVSTYKNTFSDLRREGAPSPFYPGMRELLDRLADHDGLLLGLATGKSRRGLDSLLEAHGIAGHFATRQVADDHPSKPHPSMVLSALAETGVGEDAAVMIGDTQFDMEMGRNAGIGTIGVTWGYHPEHALVAAHVLVSTAEDLEALLTGGGER